MRCRGQQVEIPPELQNPQTTVAIRADTQEKDHDSFRLLGHVEVIYKDMKLHADEASFNQANGDVHAKGHVEFSDPTSHLEADEAFYNVQTGVGWFTNGRGTVHAHYAPGAHAIDQGPFLYPSCPSRAPERDRVYR
jgi:lipopolysaccharide assembly outer membrane protein LptD (OstA)